MGGQQPIGAAEDGVLFMDKCWTALGDGRNQGWCRRIATKTDDNADIKTIKGTSCLQDPACDGHTRLRQPDRTRACGCVQSQAFYRRETVSIVFTASVGRKNDRPPPTCHLKGQGLGWKHVATSSTGGDDTDPRVHTHIPNDPAAWLTFPAHARAWQKGPPAHRHQVGVSSAPGQTPWSAPWPAWKSLHS